ncbi:hypothetical protein ACHAWC_006145 [Mediolabrus comicus]
MSSTEISTDDDAMKDSPAVTDGGTEDGDLNQPPNNNNTKKGAPQSKEEDNDVDKSSTTATTAPVSPGDSGGGNGDDEVLMDGDGGGGEDFEECKLTPVDAENQKRTLMNALNNNDEFPKPPIDEDNQQQQSSLHQDEYTQFQNQPHHPNNHESALSNSGSGRGGGSSGKKKKVGLSAPPFNNKTKQQTRQRLKGKGHSHPRKSPYRSEVARLRHEQQQVRRGSADNSVSTASSNTTTKNYNRPPDSSDFWKQSTKFKHMLLNSFGDFLTGAFSDNEETSASYYSQDLLDQLSNDDPTVVGVWLQAKNLNDDDVRQLCDNLMRNTNVSEVWLPGNFITDEGARYIAHMLKFNKSIKELFLGQNDIGPKGAAALAAALARGNSTLVALGLGENHVGVEGAGAFAAALRHNHTLRTLDLKKNGIPRSSSIRALLSKMLEFNASDPGDESLVLGLQEELSSLIAKLPEDSAQDVVVKAEEALKTAMICRRKGDISGAAEAEGLFIRICTTGEAPIDPPEETTIDGVTVSRKGGRREGDRVAAKARSSGRNKKGSTTRRMKPSEPDRLDAINEELSALHFAEQAKNGGNDDDNGGDNHFDDEGKEEEAEEEEGGKVDDAAAASGEVGNKEDGGRDDSDKKESVEDNTKTAEAGGGEEGTTKEEVLEP